MNIYEKIENGLIITDSEFMTCNEKPIDLFRAYERRIAILVKNNDVNCNQYEAVVKQNKSLQSEIKTLKEAPFFPYALNDGKRIDFGEFYLISHAWFSFLNTTDTIGIVEVEYKDTNHSRKMYMGIGTGGDWTADVLKIAQYGQKIKG